MRTKVTQRDKIRRHLQAGNPITGLDAWRIYRIYRLSAVIYDLRAEGLIIDTEMVKDPETGVICGQYGLAPEPGTQAGLLG